LTKEVKVLSKPVAFFTFWPTEGIVPLEVTFDAWDSYDQDGNIVVYKWDFGDGSTGYGKNVTHTYNIGGDLVITLTVIDNDDLEDWLSKQIFLIQKPFPPINVKVKRVVNDGLFISDYINLVSWQENPKNNGKFNIIKYKIYRKRKGEGNKSYVFIAEVDSNTFEYEDRDFESQEEMNQYLYEVTAVDDNYRESEFQSTDIFEPLSPDTENLNPANPTLKKKASR